MKKIAIWTLIVLAGLVFAAAIVFAGSGRQKMPGANATDFYAYITKGHPYLKWQLWPGHEAMHPGKSPHGAYLKLYVNRVALDAIKKKMKTMPDGAIIVKENYGDDMKTLVALTPMYKIKGFNPDAGDWFWAEYGPDGNEMASGKVQACIDCHAMQKGMDYIYTWSK